jgi:ATP-dependent DNA helicase UvrD/PcrA
VAWDDELDEDQAAIASDPAGRIRLVAGPGTGKTRVMTRRIAWLIEERGVAPESILAVTFSRAAARELRQRLDNLLGADVASGVAVFTLHAFALRQLLRNQGAPTLPRPIRIAGDFDERWVIEEELRTLTSAKKITEIRRELKNLASDWETLAADADEWEREHPNPRFLGAWRAHRTVYGYTLRAELVYGVKKGLEQDPEFDIEGDFQHVVVDEYQDLNHCEIEVVRALVGRGPDIFSAGDDDQSIYGFRNAFPLGLREFAQTYPGSVERELEICHRCDEAILELALRVAEQDIDRIPKRLRPEDDAEGGEVRAFAFNNISEEARGIAGLCEDLVARHVRPNEILILLRNDPQGVYSAPIIRALEERGILAELPADPFQALGEGDGRLAVLLLRLLRSREDSLAWREVLALRENGIGDGTLLNVYRLAEERGERYAATLQAIAEDPELLGGAMRKKLAAEIRRVNELLAELQELFQAPAADALDDVLEEVGGDPEELHELSCHS